MHFKALVLILLFVLSPCSFATTKQLEKETTVFNQTFSWQAMGGVSLLYSPSILEGVEQRDIGDVLSLSLMIDVYYKGFYIQKNHRRAESMFLGGEFGYELHTAKSWGIDIINKTYLFGYDSEDLIDDNDKDIPTLSGLPDRKSGDGIGLRYSHYIKNDVFSVDVATLAPLSKSDGWLIDLYYSHLILYRNWDIYLGGQFTYYTADITDYFVGIDHDEVNEYRSYYRPGGSFKAQFEVFAQHPISKNWTFNTGITQSYYSNNVMDSPIVDKQHVTQVMLGALYVF